MSAATGRPPREKRWSSAQTYVRRRRAFVLSGLAAILFLSVACVAWVTSSPNRSRAAAQSTSASTAAVRGAGAVRADRSVGSVLPGPVLIADRGNNRLIEVDPAGRVVWQFPRPGDLAPGETFKVPDDVFFTPDGKQLVATQEDDFVVTLIDIATHKIVWRYGTPGTFGSGANQLWNPDDAIMLRDGSIVVSDIKNCRIVMLTRGALVPARQFGRTGHCTHFPPARFSSPNGAFPQPDGHVLVTEIGGDWVTSMGLDGSVAWSAHAPGVRYPSDTNQVGPDRFLTVDFSSPGKVVEFDHTGRLLWEYAPTGADALDKPSLAEPLPNGDVLVTDDDNNRVIVVDPRTNTVVWQYGHKGIAGSGPGFLSDPDGADLAPPHSLVGAGR